MSQLQEREESLRAREQAVHGEHKWAESVLQSTQKKEIELLTSLQQVRGVSHGYISLSHVLWNWHEVGVTVLCLCFFLVG